MAVRGGSALAVFLHLVLVLFLSHALPSLADSLSTASNADSRRLQAASGGPSQGARKAFAPRLRSELEKDEGAFGAVEAEECTAGTGKKCRSREWAPVTIVDDGLFDVINPTISGDEKDELNWRVHQQEEGAGTPESNGERSEPRDQAKARTLTKGGDAGRKPRNDQDKTKPRVDASIDGKLAGPDDGDSSPIGASSATPAEKPEDAVPKPGRADWNPWKLLDENPLPNNRENWEEEEDTEDADIDPDVLPDAPDGSPRDVIPDPGDDVAPDPGDDVIPDPGDDVIPDPGDDVIPDPGDDVIPDPGDDVAPDPGDDVIPDPGDDVIPDPGDDVAPDPGDDVIPDPGDDVAPDPGDDVAPDPGDDVIPDPGDDVIPDPGGDVAPDPGDDVIPDPGDDVIPDPGDDVAPDPGDDVIPDPDGEAVHPPGKEKSPGDGSGGRTRRGSSPSEPTKKEPDTSSSTPSPGDESTPVDSGVTKWSGAGVYRGTAITLNAQWIDTHAVGQQGIRLEYQESVFPAPPVLRKVAVKSTWNQTVKIFVRTTRARFSPAPRPIFTPPETATFSDSSLSPWWSTWTSSAVHAAMAATSSVAGFLFGTDAGWSSEEKPEAKGPTITSLKNMLKQYRRFKRKHPGKPGELVIDFCKDEYDSSSVSHAASSPSVPESSSTGPVRASHKSSKDSPSSSAPSPSASSSFVGQNTRRDNKAETEGVRRTVSSSESRSAQEENQNRKKRPKKRRKALANAHNILETQDGLALVNRIRDKMTELFGTPSTAVQALVSTGHVIVTLPAEGVDRSRLQALLETIQDTFGNNIEQWSFSEIVQLRTVVRESDPRPHAQMVAKMESLSGKSAQSSKASSLSARSEIARKKSPFEGSMPTDSALESKLYGMYMITATNAWIHGESGDGTVVAVVDSGISPHPDLDCNFWKNPYEEQDGRDDDGNGLIDDQRGYDFEENRSEPDDRNGHGTHVAGIIGACANGGGTVGGAPKTQLMALRFIDKNGLGSMANSIRALNYAIDHGVQVINNSWGGPQSTAVLRRLVHMSAAARNGKGILLLNAAGNESSNNDVYPSYPANWDQDNTISVAAIDINGELADFSNYGREAVDMGAPGVKIYSTKPGGDYQHMSGTSMATPHVSAVAALIFGAFLRNGYDAPAAEVKDIIRLTASPVDQLKDVTRWGTRPNAGDAVLMARMGGMFAQAKCEDMVFELDAGSAHIVDIHLMGYRRGTYTADLTFDVFSENGYRLDQIRVPMKLVISSEPREDDNDSRAAAAFSDVVSTFSAHPSEGFEELCRLQAKIHAERKASPAMIIAICVGVLAVVLALLLAILCCRSG
ncbi:unnamed protein product [Neospora caninum Liverpool]|nr:uncharacterized protein NCLIV_057550 [Neospora caninum Liverpool]CBZ55332.1 unnamed protein product [Neospora caninum Liverpool]|eukprot:XP_003885360.1 uncharacterized protein NCLIV_057550 [Neospora caninum Liverpool]